MNVLNADNAEWRVTMAEPTEKSPSIEAELDKLAPHGRVLSIVSNRCATCGEDAVEFRDDLSCREYRISGMCQVCQESIFGE